MTSEEAREVFDDDYEVVEVDEAHSICEQRYRIIGASSQWLLFVVYTEREGEMIWDPFGARSKTTRRKSIMRAKKKSDEVHFDVMEEQYRAMQAKGIDVEALLKPGPHKFMRGLFKTKTHPSEPKQAKVRISIYLDADVLAYFRARAAQPNAAPYQTQINNELRAIMEPQAPKTVSVQTETQINDELRAIMEPQVAKTVSVQTETQINNELRAIMEREAPANPSGRSPAKSVTNSSGAAVDYSALLDDPEFIAAVAERVRRAPQSRKPRRKPA